METLVSGRLEMPHQFYASVIVTLSDDPTRMAAELADIAGAWAEFLAKIKSLEAETCVKANSDGQPEMTTLRG